MSTVPRGYVTIPEQRLPSSAARPLPWLQDLVRTARLVEIAGLLLVLFVAFREQAFWGPRFYFDDAYMYARYAYNFRHGWGLAWNAGGPHIFGLTSLPWFYVVLAGSFFFHHLSNLLTVLSCVTGLVAIVALTVLVSRDARSTWMQRPLRLLPWIALPLLLNTRFAQTWSNGMETMLGMLALILFLAAHKRFAAGCGWTNTAVLSAAAAFCALTRPELLLVTASLPLLHWLLCSDRRAYAQLAAFYGMLAASLGLVLLLNFRYFGTPVPLAFYLKAQHGYTGYSLIINPWRYAAIFLFIATPALLLIAGLARRRHLRTLLVFLVPLALDMLYLATVTQIMGQEARYYIPLLPLLVLPAGMLLDEAIATGLPRITLGRALAVGLVLLVGRDYTRPLTVWMGDRMAEREVVYDKPVFLPEPPRDLPGIAAWSESANFAGRLPAGSLMASSEVGMLSALAPQLRILDIAGLNDTHLARHSSDIGYIFAQKPDVIWLPHYDYTKVYGMLASSPQMLRDYDVYQQALLFGIAIRKESRKNPAFEHAVVEGWHAIYPRYPMENYRVQQVLWDPGASHPGGKDNVLERMEP